MVRNTQKLTTVATGMKEMTVTPDLKVTTTHHHGTATTRRVVVILHVTAIHHVIIILHVTIILHVITILHGIVVTSLEIVVAIHVVMIILLEEMDIRETATEMITTIHLDSRIKGEGEALVDEAEEAEVVVLGVRVVIHGLAAVASSQIMQAVVVVTSAEHLKMAAAAAGGGIQMIRAGRNLTGMMAGIEETSHLMKMERGHPLILGGNQIKWRQTVMVLLIGMKQ